MMMGEPKRWFRRPEHCWFLRFARLGPPLSISGPAERLMLAWLKGSQGQPSFVKKRVRDEEAAGRDRGDYVVSCGECVWCGRAEALPFRLGRRYHGARRGFYCSHRRPTGVA